MKSFKTYFLLISILSALALILTGCGEGGGGGTTTTATKTPAQLTSTNTPQAVSGVVQTISLRGRAGHPFGPAPAKDSRKKSPLWAIIDRLISLAKNNIVRSAGSWNSGPIQCTNGGNMTTNATWTGPTNYTDYSQIVDYQANVTFDNCIEGTESMNGSETIKVTGPLSNPTQETVSSNITYSDTHGTQNTSDDINLQINFSLTFSGMNLDQNRDFIAATISITGTISGIYNGEAINLGFDNFTGTFSNDINGNTTISNVSGSLNLSCIGGWVTITTVTPLYVPAGSDCPTAGEIVIASGGNSVKIVFASNPRITVYFNNNPVQTYNNCENVDGLCGG